jgi:DNA invertase Pin-like site-specific DNA recombinase
MSATTILTKLCKECDKQLPLDQFYEAGGTSRTTLCKVHHNLKKAKYQKEHPKPQKPKGFNKLSDTVRADILKDIKDGLVYKVIASKHHIKYATLLRWKNNKTIL